MRKKTERTKKGAALAASAAVLALLAGCAGPAPAVQPTPTAAPTARPTPQPTAQPSPTPAGPEITVVDGITYVDGILVANKTYALPQSYAPGVDDEAQAAFDEMAAAAAQDGISLFIASGYRSYDYQKGLYERYVARDGKAEADTYSARPGHSEHQTGLAFDLNKVDSSFAGTPEALWIAEHCHEYGFILRYPQDKEAVTGYCYEPWHVRYLGVDTAAAVYESGLCLEEYLGITSAYAEP